MIKSALIKNINLPGELVLLWRTEAASLLIWSGCLFFLIFSNKETVHGNIKKEEPILRHQPFWQPQIRIYHKKRKGKRAPRYLLKCGCCDGELEIYYSEDGLEIGGVNGTIADWQEILLPLLFINESKDELEEGLEPPTVDQ
jgi:hypothetical protein